MTTTNAMTDTIATLHATTKTAPTARTVAAAATIVARYYRGEIDRGSLGAAISDAILAAA